MPDMLLIGTANPPGQQESTYNGLWLKQEELADLVQNGSLRGVPVKTEHTGSNIGQVVSSFLDSSGVLCNFSWRLKPPVSREPSQRGS